MGLLNFTVVILAISLVARLKAAPPSIVILCFLFSCIVGGLIVLYRRRKLQLHLQRLNLQAQEVNQSVYELHRPDGDPLMQVVFFHGLPLEDFSVAHLSSWESEDGSCLWPKTWLVQEFPDAHILVVSYNEGLRKETVERVDMHIIAETLISDLIDANIGQRLDCPVVLVGHSFGGLVIKNLCVEGYHMLSPNINKDKVEGRRMLFSKMNMDRVTKFLDNVKGVFYYGTPHYGSPHINRAKHLLKSPLTKYFEVLSTETARLNSEFQKLPGKWQIKGVSEGRSVKSGLFRGVIVVPEAATREGHSFSVDIQADHFSINKPDKKTSTRFTALTGLLYNIAHNLQEEINLRDARALEEARPQNFQCIPQHMHMKGLGFRLDEVKAKLKNCKTLGFVGMGGLGKTTLAKALFNELASAFEFTCFVSDVKLISGNEEQLKKAVWKYMHCDGKKAGETEQWFKLREKKVLVVLDDISSDRDLEVSLDIATDTSPESRFIVTSRDHVLLEGLDDKYEVPLLDDSDSKDLFRSHASPNQLIPPKFASDMEAIVKKCGGLPLTLEVLGRYLKTKDDNKYWKQTLEALDKAEEVTDLNKRLWAKLRPSYEDLGKKEQQMFLDAGTFFSNHSKLWGKWTLGDALAAWSEAYETTSVLPLWQTLVDRSLVYKGKENEEIQMHEQLQTLARKIASESHNNDKCRVWENTEALRLVQSTHHSDNKEFHAFQLWRDSNQAKAIHIVGSALHKLKKVQFLELDDSVVIDGTVAVESFPSRLVILRCAGLKIFNPDLQSQLVILKLRVGEHLLPSSTGRLSSLRVMVLTDAKLQENMPDEIGHLSKLEHLELKGWDRLQSLPETFGKLLNLKYLEFHDCAWLHALPESFGNLVSLEHLKFSGCLLLEGLPESFGNLSALKYLKFWYCEELKALPESFGNLLTLEHLEFYKCERLKALPESFGNLSALKYLMFWSCEELKALPESFGHLVELEHLDFYSCEQLKALPESLGNLLALERLEFNRCGQLKALPESFGNLSALKYLEFGSCEELKALPESFGNLLALEHLEFESCGQLKALPESFGNLSALKYLEFWSCEELKALPESFGNLLALEHLEFKSCEQLKALPESLGNLLALERLEFNRCGQLKALPESFGNLSALKYLEFGSSEELKALPESFGNLLALERLEFNSCGQLEGLPESFGNLSALKYLKFWYCEELKALPESFGNLLTLEHLEFYKCERLKALPESFGNLSAIKYLKFWSCEELKALPESFGNLLALEDLEFYSCEQLQALPESFGNLSALKHLCFQHCRALRALSESFGQLSKLQCLRINGMFCLSEIDKLHKALAELMALNHLILQCVSVESIPNYIRSMRSLQTLELGRLPFINQLPTWFGNTGMAPLALSHKTFRKQDGHFTLAEEETTSWEDDDVINVIELVMARALKKVRASDYEGALADCCLIDPELLEDGPSLAKGFLLQQRGIAKRFVGDLQGALEDLTVALEVFSGIFNSHTHAYAYDCWKHRGFVFFLLSDVEAAQRDGAMALKVLSKYTSKSLIRPSLGDELVIYMDFKLKTASKIEEDMELMNSSHSQVMEKVRASDPHAALALWEDFNARVSGYHDPAFFLQERGIIKRLAGDMQGALDDLTTALEICDYDSYGCFKNRGYVKYLMGDQDGAEKDGLMALKVVDTVRDNVKSSLADELVTFMHFRLKGRKEIDEERRGSPHFQVMKKVRELDFFGALAIWEAFDAKVSGYYDQLFFLQERGILKRLVDDLHGALQDLNDASAIDPDNYECSKHRGYVKYLLGDIDGARVDAERCLAMGFKKEHYLGGYSVTFLEFNL